MRLFSVNGVDVAVKEDRISRFRARRCHCQSNEKRSGKATHSSSFLSFRRKSQCGPSPTGVFARQAGRQEMAQLPLERALSLAQIAPLRQADATAPLKKTVWSY